MKRRLCSLPTRTLRALRWTKRQLSPGCIGIQHTCRFLSWRDCCGGNAKAESRSWAILHLEPLTERVMPGEASGGLVAVLLGISVVDPVATGLALTGQTPQTPLDSDKRDTVVAAATTTAEPINQSPVL